MSDFDSNEFEDHNHINVREWHKIKKLSDSLIDDIFCTFYVLVNKNSCAPLKEACDVIIANTTKEISVSYFHDPIYLCTKVLDKVVQEWFASQSLLQHPLLAFEINQVQQSHYNLSNHCLTLITLLSHAEYTQSLFVLDLMQKEVNKSLQYINRYLSKTPHYKYLNACFYAYRELIINEIKNLKSL